MKNLKIKFIIDGKSVDPKSIRDVLERAILERLREAIHEQVGSIRDPDTGEFPTVIIHGPDIKNLQCLVEGSPKLISIVQERFGMVEEAKDSPSPKPSVFLSYSSVDRDLAEKLAHSLEANGIETWWDQWCISPGDSLRQKIDEGISECTHFLVLLTPPSITKPWVNQEMDAGLVRKLNEQCCFIPVRNNISVSSLPPLLSGMSSPDIATDEDIEQLVHDIHGVTRRPPRSAPPPIVSASADIKTGYSFAATAIARFCVENTKHGRFADPEIMVSELSQVLGVSTDDTEDALYELSRFIEKTPDGLWRVQGSLFSEFDHYWKPWNPAEDALKLGADILNDPNFPSNCQQIAEQYGWEPRRLNPAIHYLLERGLVTESDELGAQPFTTAYVRRTDHLRRFFKGRL